MMFRVLVSIWIGLLLFLLTACEQKPDIGQTPFEPKEVWRIPISDVIDAGAGKDGIPALSFPSFIQAYQATYMEPEDLVIGVINNGVAQAYPHKILDHHEIINDTLNDAPVAITYCPLTGTSMIWNRILHGDTLTFGVSGLIYNSNLILYDRQTESNWSQMLREGVNGVYSGKKIKLVPLVEMSWAKWKEYHPETRVMSSATGFDRGYTAFPYLDYRSNHDFFLFPVDTLNPSLPAKERVLGVQEGTQSKVYRFASFPESPTLLHDFVEGKPLVIAGSEKEGFIVAYSRQLSDGSLLDFEAIANKFPQLMKDQEGTIWNIHGHAIAGPRKDTKLQTVEAYMGYWFAWASFYPDVEVQE